jgi:hypothetical protein
MRRGRERSGLSVDAWNQYSTCEQRKHTDTNSYAELRMQFHRDLTRWVVIKPGCTAVFCAADSVGKMVSKSARPKRESRLAATPDAGYLFLQICMGERVITLAEDVGRMAAISGGSFSTLLISISTATDLFRISTDRTSWH